MKILYHLLFILLASCAKGKAVYIGSTPANSTVKVFLGIPISDSIDFIRWELVLSGYQYALKCNFGIGKPNTNGFINGGKKIVLKGGLTKEGSYYRLQHNNKTILLAALNAHVLQFANEDKSFMPGNGGWSYTLAIQSETKFPLQTRPKPIVLKDSMVFEGRTPCRGISNPGIRLSENCYKLKWSLVLYASKGKPTTYRTRGIIVPRAGIWKFKNGMILLEAEHPVYLIMPDTNIILFTDAKWNLLQGDEDFSYTLNRK